LDFVPPLVFLASYIEGTSNFRNIATLRYKESDRVKELINLLDLFKVKYRYEQHTLAIEGGHRIGQEVDYNAPRDHRIIMTAYLFLRYNKGGNIFNAKYVEKSFPHFFKVLNSI
jgi:3-phosphoshikimate 1-carboxyvinyltransferase